MTPIDSTNDHNTKFDIVSFPLMTPIDSTNDHNTKFAH